MNTQDAFEVKLRCENCGTEWKKQFQATDRVSEGGRGVFFRKEAQESAQYIRCPLCGLAANKTIGLPHITILQRSPLES